MGDKIKLEEELEFLKESFEADVISKEEYEKAKTRLEAQIKEAEEMSEIKPEKKEEKSEEKVEEGKKVEENKKEEKPTEEVKEIKVEEKKPEVKEDEPASKEEIEIKEIKEPSKFKEGKKEEIAEETEKEEKIDEKEEDTSDIISSKNEFKAEEEKKKMGMWVPIAAFIFLIVIGYFSFLFITSEKPIENNIEEITPVCFSDTECVQEGMLGFCNNPGNKDAECEFKEAVQVNFIVLNAEDCFNCDTSRVEKIIKGWFPGAVKDEIEFNSEEGKLLVEELDIGLLPAYIFDSYLEETFGFEELKSIFSKVDDKYILSSGASGSTFYVNKQAVPNRLDVFLMRDDSSTEKAEENIEEFLDLFNDKIEYNKYLINKESSMVKSLGINTFPTFLVNNKIRFSGVQPAETIKENFCKLNELDECSKKLTESLV